MLKSSTCGKKCTAEERTSPTMSAPSAAPCMLPSPPITTTAKASTITSTPMPGTTETVGAVRAPPMAASMVPSVKVTR
jgi:hypothetical protein